jgi:3-deoxy-D-manno-octulosonic-acid transferase
MSILYRTGILFYTISLKVASLFNEKARLFVKGRKNWRKNLALKIETNARYIWVHCASLGEFEQGRPLIEEIRKQFPEFRILLTFFSPSGYEIRKNYNQADIVMYLPVDTCRNAKKFLQLVQPEKAFFIKYEYWHFYIDELKKRNIPLYMVSSIFRENQHFFKKNLWGKWYKEMLFKTEHFFVQNEKSAQLLQSIGLKNFTVSGDTRFDRVAAIAKSAKEIPIVEKFKGSQPLLIAGSTWKPDEELLTAFVNNYPNLKVVFAPHEVTETNINRLEQLLKTTQIRFSKADENEIHRFQVLIIDSVGLLSSLYLYGNLAYIGGGFGVGIHNILEAATFGLPVIFGPNYEKFKEAVDLKKLGGAYPFHNFKELEFTLNKFLNNNSQLLKASAVCKNYVAKNTGSSNLIIKKVFNN